MRTLALLLFLFTAATARAQAPDAAWQACTTVADAARRLACFDAWAQQQPAPPMAPAVAPAPAAAPARTETAATGPLPSPIAARRGLRLTATEGCHDSRGTALSRFWELDAASDCGTFGIRGFRPISLDLAQGSSVNGLPTSENAANDAATNIDYRHTEMRLQLSVRTKIAQGLTAYSPSQLDSLWFAYSQQSYWQLFTPALSRPFRSTDHEPEVIYVRPLQAAQEGAWRWRFGGVGLVHQSNGQSLPLSRSWNRVYLMAGGEKDGLQLQARLWKRLHESAERDDNPGISEFIGRGELVGRWQANRGNLFAVTARHNLRNSDGGSLRLEWFRALADPGEGTPSGLQLHTQLFTGYGDTLLDYNRRRTVFSIGLSLVEW